MLRVDLAREVSCVLGVRCDEPEVATNGKSYNRGVIEFDRDDDTEVDWIA
jgi:hypothetical protein